MKKRFLLPLKSTHLMLAAVVNAAYAYDPLVEDIHEPKAEHADQLEFVALVASGRHHEAFAMAFEQGDGLFETVFNTLDGVGANVGQGQRFTRVPRADLRGPGEWARHVPLRETGPNAQACNACHDLPVDDGAGETSRNVHRDPRHTGALGKFIQRNTPHVFAPGALQVLAEEMTAELHRRRDEAVAEVCSSRRNSASIALQAKGISFGRLTVNQLRRNPCTVNIDTSRVQGVDADLVIKPFQWKGKEGSLRSFNRGAAHNELGMQAVEIAGDGVDGDFDFIVDELTIGDMTALTIYLAAQPRPVTRLELDALDMLDPPLDNAERQAIEHGERLFAEINCASCHRPELLIDRPVFSEPSQSPHYRDAVFPAGQNPLDRGVDSAFPVTFDLTRDQPDNVIAVNGQAVHLGAFEADPQGRAIVRLYGDLKRHDMGRELAETIDEIGTGPSVWITKELWGVGSTAPYLHDGRATTLAEAILAHGGEARASRQAFERLSPADQKDLIAFLDNLILFKLEEAE